MSTSDISQTIPLLTEPAKLSCDGIMRHITPTNEITSRIIWHNEPGQVTASLLSGDPLVDLPEVLKEIKHYLHPG